MQVPVASHAVLQSRSARVTWQVWLDGQVMRTPLPLADGLLVILDHSEPGHPSLLRRMDDEGRTVWERSLPGRVSGEPARTFGFVAVPIDGVSIHVFEAATGRVACEPLQVLGAPLVQGLTAQGGRVWARFAPAFAGAPAWLVMLDLQSGARRPPIIVADPLGATTEVFFRRTNHTLVAAAERADEPPILLGIDEGTAEVLWQRQLDCEGISDLWAIGGLIDLVCSNRVQSFEARSGTPLTTRFDDSPLEGARIAGEALLVQGKDKFGRRQLRAFDCATEDSRGRRVGVQRIIGAGSDLALVEDDDGLVALLDLPGLDALAMPEADSLEAPSLVAFSRHVAWVVGHGGRTLSAIDTA